MSNNKEFFDRDRLIDGARGYGQRGWQAGLDTFGDFRKFLLRGNVVDLAVGVVIGAAFNGLVQALVDDFIQPLLGGLVGSQDSLKDVTWKIPGTKIDLLTGHFWGIFLSFILTALVVYFLIIKPMNMLQDRFNRMTPKQPEAPSTRECPFCISQVNIKATRCAFCTAQLPPLEQEPVQAAITR